MGHEQEGRLLPYQKGLKIFAQTCPGDNVESHPPRPAIHTATNTTRTSPVFIIRLVDSPCIEHLSRRLWKGRTTGPAVRRPAYLAAYRTYGDLDKLSVGRCRISNDIQCVYGWDRRFGGRDVELSTLSRRTERAQARQARHTAHARHRERR